MSRIHRCGWLLPVGLAAVLPLLVACADDAAPAGRQYALLVGVKNYDKDQLHGLQYTEKDVNDLAAVLKGAGYKRVVLMTQSAAAGEGDNALLPTARNVRKQLAAILDDRKPDDSVLIAFSGHGVQFSGQKESYFCPMDADLENVKSLVSLAEAYNALEGSAAGTKVLLADACRNDPQAEPSKDVAKVKLESRTRPQSERAPGGVAAFFSCSEGQRSYESEKLQHGVFFHYVIEGLKGEAANKKGEVTLQGLTAYVTDEVPDAVKDVSTEARQRPQQVGDLSGAVALVAASGLDMKESPYFPMRVGTTWTYKYTDSNPDKTSESIHKITKHEKRGTMMCARLDYIEDGKAIGTQYLYVKDDGIYGMSDRDESTTHPELVLKLPPRPNETWDEPIYLGGKLLGNTKIAESDAQEVTVAGKKYTAAVISRGYVDGASLRITDKRYYVKGIGLVKHETGDLSKLVLELQKFELGGK